MPADPSRAVFLSYASQDAEAARRICESLRTGGVEVCQEHNGPGQAGRGTLQANSARGPTNFHILTSNSVSHRDGYENLLNPGYFVHCDTANAPKVVRLQGTARSTVPAAQWVNIHATLSVLELPMPVGL